VAPLCGVDPVGTKGKGSYTIRFTRDPFAVIQEGSTDNSMQHSIGQNRRSLLSRLFADGIPQLWCPPITHYDEAGAVDRARTTAHLAFIAPHVKGLLAAGTTSDGWTINDEQAQAVMTLAMESASKFDQRVLIGVLRTTQQDQIAGLRSVCKWITGSESTSTSTRLVQRHICGFTVCLPRGPSMSPMQMEYAASSYLELGLPIALYQLPQVTQNEIPPDLVYGLILKYPNLVLFKDSSGMDSVAKYKRKRGDLCLLRGAEGDYARWYSQGGGPYHGFLLSSANCFGSLLHQMLKDFGENRKEQAQLASDRLTALVNDLFSAVAGINQGNVFANANKAADHFMAFGPQAEHVEPPRLQTGDRLPVDCLREVGAVLERHGFMPTRGYLD